MNKPISSIESLIRAVADFPKPGVTFRDITPLLADAGGFARCIDAMAEPWQGSAIQAVCGIESRGFIFGAALAQKLHAGFVPLRKPNGIHSFLVAHNVETSPAYPCLENVMY